MCFCLENRVPMEIELTEAYSSVSELGVLLEYREMLLLSQKKYT